MAFYYPFERHFQLVEVRLEEGIAHPRNAEDRENRHHSGLKHRAVRNGRGVNLTGNQHHGTGNQHHHLDDEIHGKCCHFAFDFKGRTQLGQRPQQHHDSNAGEENPRRPVRLFRKALVHQRFGAAIDKFALFRVAEFFLEFRIVSQIFSATQAPECGNHHSKQRSGYGDGQNLEDPPRLTDAVLGANN
ncbi:hypothetical protein D3C72_379400 [compost metagenome]